MGEFYTSFSLLTAGVALAMSTLSLLVALKKNSDRTDILFCLMGASLTVFFLLPPPGFILSDIPPYTAEILIKRFFIYAYYGLSPWFILAYSGYPRKKLAYLTSGTVVICYVAMFLTIQDSPKPLWAIIAVVGFGGVLAQGIVASLWQLRNGQKRNAQWLMAAMVCYAVLFTLTAINQLTNGYLVQALDMKLFFPMHMHALSFMLIMGLRLADGLTEKGRLENKVQSTEQRWKSFMTNAPVIVIELDRQGNILFINQFGVKLLGYTHSSQLLNTNWFEQFPIPGDIQSLKNLYEQMLQEEMFIPSFKNKLRNKKGDELQISWVNVASKDESGKVNTVMSIGTDVTSEESSNNLIQRLQLELEKEKLNFERPLVFERDGIIGSSKAMGYATGKALQVAKTLVPVLLEGETGVGKELFANLIHKNSSRNDKPFIKINCAALPKELIEDELFGHEKGAFTSAIQSRKGRFELADGGTIFLDEIGELPMELQPKLLRVLQSGEFERIGSQKTIKVDARIIAATNRTLSKEIQHGNFRADLYYRLNVFPVTIPPLRNHKEDLPELINYYIARKCQKHSKTLDEISKANLQRLLNYHWPGNIRELKNVIERAVIASEGKALTLDWWTSQETTVTEQQPPHTLHQIERDHILSVMGKCHWKINGENGAAEVLAMHPNTLRSKMKKLGINRPTTKEPGSLEDHMVLES